MAHSSTARASSKGCIRSGIDGGGQCRSQGVDERMEGFRTEVFRSRSRQRSQRRECVQRQLWGKRQRKRKEGQREGSRERSLEERQEEAGVKKDAMEVSPGRGEGAEMQNVDAIKSADAAGGSLVGDDVFHMTLQEVIGAVANCVSRHLPLRAKKLDLGKGKKFGEVLPWVVLGLSSTHAELCKTQTTKEEILPLPLDSPFLLPRVRKASQLCQFVLLSLICGLNSLYGQGLRWKGKLTKSQESIVWFLLEESERFEKLDCAVTESDWNSFMKVRTIDYKGEEVKVAQHTSWDNVSPALPAEIGQVCLEEVCERGCKDYVINFEKYLVGEDMMKHVKPPRVMVADEEWSGMCRGLLAKGVCELIPESSIFRVNGELVLNGMFGVPKEETSDGIPVHRLIMNLIPVNELCRPIEGDTGTLPAWPSMGPLVLHPSENLVVSFEDVRCFFYIFRTPPTWRKFMAFNKIVPEEVTGPQVEPMYLTSKVLPMGFRNSVAIAQHVHRFIVRKSFEKQKMGNRLLGGECEHRRDRPFTVANPAFRVYLDNYDELEKVDVHMSSLVRGSPSASTLSLRETYQELGVPRHPRKP